MNTSIVSMCYRDAKLKEEKSDSKNFSASCRYCPNKRVSGNIFSSSNFLNHVNKHHPSEFKLFLASKITNSGRKRKREDDDVEILVPTLAKQSSTNCNAVAVCQQKTVRSPEILIKTEMADVEGQISCTGLNGKICSDGTYGNFDSSRRSTVKSTANKGTVEVLTVAFDEPLSEDCEQANAESTSKQRSDEDEGLAELLALQHQTLDAVCDLVSIHRELLQLKRDQLALEREKVEMKKVKLIGLGWRKDDTGSWSHRLPVVN